jgi:hypothetical protein
MSRRLPVLPSDFASMMLTGRLEIENGGSDGTQTRGLLRKAQVHDVLEFLQVAGAVRRWN